VVVVYIDGGVGGVRCICPTFTAQKTQQSFYGKEQQNLFQLTRSFVSTSMFTPAKRPVAVLALVLLLGGSVLLDGGG
jgi:hypothetical protein